MISGISGSEGKINDPGFIHMGRQTSGNSSGFWMAIQFEQTPRRGLTSLVLYFTTATRISISVSEIWKTVTKWNNKVLWQKKTNKKQRDFILVKNVKEKVL